MVGDGPETARSPQSREKHARLWPWAPKTSLALCSAATSEQVVTSREWPCSRAGTCLLHIPMVLASCHGFQGHLTSTRPEVFWYPGSYLQGFVPSWF